MKRFLAVVGVMAALCGSAMAQEGTRPPVDPAAVVTDATQPTDAAQPPVDPATVNDPAPAPEPPQWVGPEVKLETSMGDIVVVLDLQGAPKTAMQFLKLVKGKYYNGAIIYRIEPGFVIQFGSLDGNLGYRPPKTSKLPLETATNKHSRGALAMARGDEPDSGDATVYIDLAENSGLNATPGAPPNTTGYAVFGHVVQGMDIVDTISNVELLPEGEKFRGKEPPFPGKLPKTAVLINKAAVTKE